MKGKLSTEEAWMAYGTPEVKIPEKFSAPVEIALSIVQWAGRIVGGAVILAIFVGPFVAIAIILATCGCMR